jgi:hypothetical protein
MLCKVCSKEINTTIFETVGGQIVCCLSCVGLLQANNEDKCNECLRPVWKDNYYKIDSFFYCSEKCKKKAVKNYLKKFNTIQDINIKHIQNEFFKNDSPMKNLKELRKEVKEFYKDFDMDETATIKSIPISCKSTFRIQDNLNNNIKIIAPMKEELSNINNMSVTQPKYKKQNLSVTKYVKKYPVIPNRFSKNNSSRNNSLCNEKKIVSRKKTIENFLKRRKNFSFDNQDRYVNKNDNDEDIVFHLKYVNRKGNNSISNDRNYNKRAKLKQTFLKLKNNNIPNLKTKIAKYKIPNPLVNQLNQFNLKSKNAHKYNNYRYYEGNAENNENQNYSNLPLQIGNYYEKNYFNYNNENKEQNFIERNDIYRIEANYKCADYSYF